MNIMNTMPRIKEREQWNRLIQKKAKAQSRNMKPRSKTWIIEVETTDRKPKTLPVEDLTRFCEQRAITHPLGPARAAGKLRALYRAAKERNSDIPWHHGYRIIAEANDGK